MEAKVLESEGRKGKRKSLPFLAEGIGNRISAAAGRMRTRAEAAKAAGISDDMLYRYIREQSPPSFNAMAGLAKATGVSLEWLATGEPSQGTGYSQQPVVGSEVREGYVADLQNDRYAMIPVYNVQASAGGGSLVENEQVAYSLAFRRDWISRELNATPADLYLINVIGESMEPTLRPGDVILVDRRVPERGPVDGIHVMRMDDSLLVKRLQRLPGRRLKVSSDNSAYEPFEVELAALDGEMSVLGRVVWAGRRM